MNVLVITAHADDLELSMGGSIKKWTSNGGRVDNIIMVSDEEREDAIDKTTVMLGHRAIFYPKHLLGTERPTISGKLVKDMEEFIRTCSFTKQIEEYDYVITHWKEDWHQDHRVCYDLVRSMQRNQPMQVMYMESYPYCNKYSSFDANVFVDTTNTQVDKENSILAFNGVFPHYWVHAVEAHDKYRGSFIKAKYAECFKLDTMIL
jgi:LmbE family N-acetylglucosaminyl deacetylase